ncbi:MarR family transcriptional regulator [Aurantimonas sp. A2-1-M11]|uniref:MarR family winged helix-turn-helix transcriptional regulator n=1 Tax=Aurantimonas sp. A2-1-M11 TaxID=3113712 RepID=UPI002F9575B5
MTTQLSLAARSARTALSQRLAQIDVYPGQDAVLLAIGEEDGISLRDLAERLSVRPPTITKTVTRLASQGLVEKRLSDSDGRQNHAHLTERGAAIVDAVGKSRKRIEREALKGFSNKERKALRKLLERVTANLDGASTLPAAARSAAEDND